MPIDYDPDRDSYDGNSDDPTLQNEEFMRVIPEKVVPREQQPLKQYTPPKTTATTRSEEAIVRSSRR